VRSEAEIAALRRAVIAEAREWILTPFHHEQRCKGVGVDCTGLVIAVGEAAGASHFDRRTLKGFWEFYGRRPNPEKMREALLAFLVPIPESEATIADIAWMHWGDEMPIHLALRSEFDGREMLIHSVVRYGVMEHGFQQEFRERVTEWWRYPAIAGREV